ncbi:MAG: iron complex transport system substrate-binding protein [Euryarchaeota archaeon]|nr:iron complex transport system substrate-binding protein [Euryarchaeota archaeon]
MLAKRMIWVLVCLSMLVIAASAEKVTVVDSTGRSVDVEAPVQRVVSLGTGVAEYLFALDGGKCLVGRDSYSHFPPALENVTVAGKSSYSPDLELIMQLDPDLMIADTMLSDDDLKELEDAGIPVMIESLIDPTKDIEVMERLNSLVGNEARAEELIEFIQKHRDLIEERTADLKADEKPKVFFEWAGKEYYTVSQGNPTDTLIRLAGGNNIAKDLGNSTHTYPTVSPEWVLDMDPDVIIQQRSSDKPFTDEELMKLRDAIISRPELSDVTAIKDGRTYVISSEIRYGLRSVISELYMAKWFHPDIFSDLDPEALHKEMIEEFYGIELEGAYAYPSSP